MLPRDLAGREVVRALERAGWQGVRTKGSHALLQRVGHDYTLSVPLHDRMGRGVLRTIIRDSGMTVDEFVSFLK